MTGSDTAGPRWWTSVRGRPSYRGPASVPDISPPSACRQRSPLLTTPQYTAGAFQAACARLGVRQSMGRVGSALDNAVIESWHFTLEFELRRDARFTTRAQGRGAVVDWIDDYNHDRRHSALGMRSPIAYEQALTSPSPEQAA